MMTTRMIARTLGIGPPNELRRGSDRLEVAVLWFALLTSLLMMPIGAAIGTSAARAELDQSAETRSSGSTVMATTVDAVPVNPASSIAVSMPAPATWTDTTGGPHTVIVQVPQGTRAGSVVKVWLDRDGNPVEPPRPSGVIALYGAIVGIGVFVCGLAGIWFVVALVRAVLDRWRYTRWQNEWRKVAPPLGRTKS